MDNIVVKKNMKGVCVVLTWIDEYVNGLSDGRSKQILRNEKTEKVKQNLILSVGI